MKFMVLAICLSISGNVLGSGKPRSVKTFLKAVKNVGGSKFDSHQLESMYAFALHSAVTHNGHRVLEKVIQQARKKIPHLIKTHHLSNNVNLDLALLYGAFHSAPINNLNYLIEQGVSVGWVMTLATSHVDSDGFARVFKELNPFLEVEDINRSIIGNLMRRSDYSSIDLLVKENFADVHEALLIGFTEENEDMVSFSIERGAKIEKAHEMLLRDLEKMSPTAENEKHRYLYLQKVGEKMQRALNN